MRALPGVLALAFCLTGCSLLDHHDCTTMGGSSGVSFDLSELTIADGTTVHACVGTVCTDGQVDRTSGFTRVDDESLTAEGPVPVSLRLTDPAGTVAFDATGTAVLQRVDVNGNGCGPIVYQESVVAGPDGTLSAG